MNQKYDFYSGYEGEPEYVFRLTQASSHSIHTWGGHIDAIMSAVAPGPSGWHSLAKYYHLDEGWFEESPWLVPELSTALDQLGSVNISGLDEEPKRVLAALCELFQAALDQDLGVVIVYD